MSTRAVQLSGFDAGCHHAENQIINLLHKELLHNLPEGEHNCVKRKARRKLLEKLIKQIREGALWKP